MIDADDRWEETIAGAAELLGRFSIPLYHDDEQGRPVLFGTAFLVARAGAHFLVSAAHVLDQALETGLYFYGAPSTRVHVYGTLMRTSSLEQRASDLADVGVVKLHEDIRPPFREVDKFAVDASYLRPQYLPRSGRHYIINGFPEKKSEVDRDAKSVTVTAYAYRSDPAGDGDYERMGLSQEMHLVLPFNRKKGRDSHGRISHFPKPHGMSGAPIFVLYEESGDSRRGFPLVGIGIEYYEHKKLMVGTDIGVAIEGMDLLLAQSAAQLRP
ncbi:hypothetical protein BWI17_16320 [Betaproteobacteria bacterium GR16-43]|nr:hypothetical protein BWI17_16320 [Betaproteobacteria bacterium GR16-43]